MDPGSSDQLQTLQARRQRRRRWLMTQASREDDLVAQRMLVILAAAVTAAASEHERRPACPSLFGGQLHPGLQTSFDDDCACPSNNLVLCGQSLSKRKAIWRLVVKTQGDSALTFGWAARLG